MEISNDDLQNIPKYAMDFNGKGGAIVNRDMLKSICNELLSYRMTYKGKEKNCKHEDVGRITDYYGNTARTWCRCHDCEKIWYEYKTL